MGLRELCFRSEREALALGYPGIGRVSFCFCSFFVAAANSVSIDFVSEVRKQKIAHRTHHKSIASSSRTLRDMSRLHSSCCGLIDLPGKARGQKTTWKKKDGALHMWVALPPQSGRESERKEQ